MENVLEIQRLPPVTTIPRTPSWLHGVANLRGGIVSIVDFARLMDLTSSASAKDRRMIVVQSLIDDISVGLVVDQVLGIRWFEKGRIDAPTAPVNGKLAPFLSGLIEHDDTLVAVVDIEKILLSRELRQFDAA